MYQQQQTCKNLNQQTTRNIKQNKQNYYSKFDYEINIKKWRHHSFKLQQLLQLLLMRL